MHISAYLGCSGANIDTGTTAIATCLVDMWSQKYAIWFDPNRILNFDTFLITPSTTCAVPGNTALTVDDGQGNFFRLQIKSLQGARRTGSDAISTEITPAGETIDKWKALIVDLDSLLLTGRGAFPTAQTQGAEIWLR